jgi:hypothetical protein
MLSLCLIITKVTFYKSSEYQGALSEFTFPLTYTTGDGRASRMYSNITNVFESDFLMDGEAMKV